MKIVSFNKETKTFLFLLVSLLLFSFLISVGSVEIIDDAYIYFRYVYNLVNGHGYVYNPGQPLEATTGLTWTLLLSFASWFTIPPEISARILSYLFGVTIVILLWIELRNIKVASNVLIVVLLLFVTNQSFYASIMMGLETGLYSLLLIILYLVSGRYSKSLYYQILFGITCLLLFLTRPESLLVLLLIIFGLIIFRFDNEKSPIIALSVILITGILLTTLWRLTVFGDFLPNSVRAKSVLIESIGHIYILLPRMLQGAVYILNWILSSVFITVPAILSIKFLLKTRSFKMYVAGTIIITGIFAALLNGGDWMPFSRLLTPYLPVVAILSAIAINKFLQHQKWLSHKQLNVLTIIFVFLLILNSFRIVWPISFFKYEQWTFEKGYEDAGSVLLPLLTQKSVIAPEAIGRIGYILKDVTILDFFGLTEPYITNNGTLPRAEYNMGRHHYEYTMVKHPDLFLLHSELGNHIPYLNKWGYSEKYKTYYLSNKHGEIIIGIKNSLVDSLLPPLQSVFKIQTINTKNIIRNPAATWPLGER